jgi:hypothetical protein
MPAPGRRFDDPFDQIGASGRPAPRYGAVGLVFDSTASMLT